MNDTILFAVALIGSVVIHEYAHALVANWFGDPTPRRMGRLTLNPIPHIDPIGSVLLPLLIIFLGSPIWFAWAKPVPITPSFFSNPKSGMMWVALAGPLSNITLAVLVSLLLRVSGGFEPFFSSGIGLFFQKVIYLNIGLAVFNMLPIPPLDGSRILSRFLPDRWLIRYLSFESYGFVLILGLSFLGVLNPIVWVPTQALFRFLLVGI